MGVRKWKPKEWILHRDMDISEWGDLVSGYADGKGNLVGPTGNIVAWGNREDAEAALADQNRDMAMRDVTPHARRKLKGILDHYRGKPHPFAACVRDNRKRFGPGTEAVCAVVKDLAYGTTDWRRKGFEKKHKKALKAGRGADLADTEYADFEVDDDMIDAWLAERPDVLTALAEGSEYGDLALTPEQERVVITDYMGDVALWLAAEFAEWELGDDHEPPPAPPKKRAEPTSERTRSVAKAQAEAVKWRKKGDARKTAFWEARVRALTAKEKVRAKAEPPTS